MADYVHLYLNQSTPEEVSQFLQEKYPVQTGPPWIAMVNGNPCLWIQEFIPDVFDGLFHIGESEEEDQRWEEDLKKHLGSKPTVVIPVRISSRFGNPLVKALSADLQQELGHGVVTNNQSPGGHLDHARKAVLDLLRSVLDRFHGILQDDYSDHFWTLQEIEQGLQVKGHRFFDPQGWYDELYPNGLP